MLFVADALAGASGLYRVNVRDTAPVAELVIAALPQLESLVVGDFGGIGGAGRGGRVGRRFSA